MPRSIRTLSIKSTPAALRLSHNTRKTHTFEGDEHVVRSITLLQSGVVDGELIPADVLEFSALACAGRKVYDTPPGENDLTPAFTEKHFYGHVFSPRMSGSNLAADIWISPKRAKALGGTAADLLELVEKDKPVELHASVVVEVENRSGTHEGTRYTRVWTRIEYLIGVSLSIPSVQVSANRTSAQIQSPAVYAAESAYVHEYGHRHRTQTQSIRPQSIRVAKATRESISPPLDRSTDMERILKGALGIALARQAGGNALDEVFTALGNLTLHPQSGFGRSRLSTIMGQGRHRDIDHLFVNHLTDLRTAAGLTQKQLGEQLSVTDQTISNWTTQATTPPEAVRDSVISHLVSRIMTRLDEEIPIPEDRMDEAFAHFQTLATMRRYLFLGRTPQMPTEMRANTDQDEPVADPLKSWSSASALRKARENSAANSGDPHRVAKYLRR